MGITGLLPFLDKASERINVKSLAGKTVAIDSYCWLHKGAFAVGDKLARGEETNVHISYCLKYVNMLLSHNIKPILVFDGRHLPAKAETEAKRRESRKNAKQRAREYMLKGDHNNASKYLRQCVDVTHEMALKLIQACREINVDCIVAPYEADGQLAYLDKIAIADYVITEDSDLTLFGCKRILFKLDLTGACTLVDASKLHLAMGCSIEKFTMDKFRYMCILSGCDYVESLPGIGLVKACKFILKTEETDMMRALDKIPAYLNMRQLTVTEEYKINVIKANATFKHMVVYDPQKRKQVRLHEPEETGTDAIYCSNAGEILDDETSLHLAVGNLNPFTMKRLDNWHPDNSKKVDVKTNKWKQPKIAKHPSIWQKGFTFAVKRAAITSPPSAIKKSNSLPIFIQARRSLALAEVEEQTSESSEVNSEELLTEYLAHKQPPLKKFKDNVHSFSKESSDDVEKMDISMTENASPQRTPKHNPFKKQTIDDDVLVSPTKITRTNNSLVKNHSPVKRIDYTRLEKLSKFNRTVLSNDQSVISRFFTRSCDLQVVNKSETIPSNAKSSENESSSTESSQSEKREEHFMLETIVSGMESIDTASSQGTISGSSSQSLENASQSNNNKTDTTLDKDTIEVSDDNDEPDCKSFIKQFTYKKQTDTVKRRSVCRRPGLAAKKSQKEASSRFEPTTVQSRLSMFGFQTKSQAS